MVTIGLDAEPDDALPPRVLNAIAIGDERIWVPELMATTPGVHSDRLLFSAKEPVYKAWFPLTSRRLGFKDAVITVHPGEATFIARLLVPGATVADRWLTGFTGRWLVRNGLVVTMTALPA
jgi:4'-phosphopantetheinyl transferase EntD